MARLPASNKMIFEGLIIVRKWEMKLIGCLRFSRLDRAHAVVACTLLGLVALWCAGCDSGKTIYPTTGTVTFQDGTPLRAGTVSFQTMEKGTEFRSARGDIHEDGKFTMTTLKAGDGAPLGKNRVIVNGPVDRAPRGPNYAPPPVGQKVNKKFASYDTSELEFTVTKDASQNNFKITVTGP